MNVVKKNFTLDHLTDTEFEEYSFDLLKAMEFINVRWRKGTGLPTSPSDRGRDIECELIRQDIDSTNFIEKWFVDSKHYKKGVPPDKIRNAIAWAEAKRPDVLLLIASNFFSNPTKDYIEEYKNNSKPKFRIKLWELPDLKDFSKGKPLLLSKYNLSEELEFLNIMHPAHLAYIKELKLNTLDFLFKCFDELDKDKRDEITSWIWEIIIKPKRRKPMSGKETMGSLLIDKVDYEEFKKKSYQIVQTGVIDNILLTHFIVNFLLQTVFSQGDTTVIEQKVRKQKNTLEFMTELEQNEPDKKELIKDVQLRIVELIKRLPSRTKECYDIYIYFCENVITKLLDEYIPINIPTAVLKKNGTKE